MALNGSVSVEATPKGQDLLVFSWSAVQDAAANASTVSWIMQLVASTAGAINGVPVERDWTVTVDGQEFTGTADVNISNNETKTLATGEIVLEHNEDGTRSFDFEFSQALYITWSGTTEIGVVSGSGTGELDAIVEPEPKPEKFDIQGFMMGLLAMVLYSRQIQWPNREPVAYLYNGVRLPDIYSVYTPELQEQCPCVAIYGRTDGYDLIVSERAGEVYGTAIGIPRIEMASASSGHYWKAWTLYTGTTKWADHKLSFEGGQEEMNFPLESLIWTNHDIYYKDSVTVQSDLRGTLYTNAYPDPIPVYE